ncbi:MAG: UPF0280 family protein [Chrysiogenales bacterium]|nr:MAG: UPF0280 family protein [Chrysiogenales bacterium]
MKVETSDLFIRAGSNLSGIAEPVVRSLRDDIWKHIERQGSFLSSYTPVEPLSGCPDVVSMMYEASERAGVGPMAAVAGAVAEMTGRKLAAYSEEIIIENGGDVWMKINRPSRVSVFPGGHSFKGVALAIDPSLTPCGVCTSSARIGPSFSFGRADAATVIAPSAALADALATEVCNRVTDEEDMQEAAAFGMRHGAAGVLIICHDRLLALGGVELADISDGVLS